ncbi:hypothetical protein [Halorubellus litoreus]|uniref:Uncharacterized protein n=1 Tax=Halorubellus litoreus TaxID=755308 RepID=A0ABD5VHD6_9EURY
MNRRHFLGSIAAASAVTLPGRARGTQSAFVDEFGYAVVDFFDDDWDESGLKNAVSETVDSVCYAYGKLDDPEEVESTQESGFLSSFQQVGLEELQENPDAYDWLLEYLDDIGEFLGWLDVFPDRIAEEVSDLADKASRFTKYVPLVSSVKGVLDSGCGIHEQLEAGKSPSADRYVEFFKYVALTIVEVILLILSFGASYRVAYSVTGKINQLLIHRVGRSIGWRAYSWVLSQIHWGVRVAFGEGMAQSINQTVGTVSEEVVSASRGTDNPVSEKRASELARKDVKQMAERTDDWGIKYELWETQQWIEQQRRSAMKEADRLRRQAEAFFGNLPL